MCNNNILTTDSRTPAKIEINSLGHKKVMASFDGGIITSDAGATLLQAAEQNVCVVSKIAQCIRDKRDKNKINHTVSDMLMQLITQIACGYEDLNDSDKLRNDPVFKLINDEPTQTGKALASAPTLCRFENSISDAELIKIGEMFVERFVESRRNKPPQKIIVDLDATDDETYGQQEFSFYHGYYGCYCFLPLVITVCCDEEEEFEPIGAILRPGNFHASHGAITILKRIIKIIRGAFPDVGIMLRGDCGFAIPDIYQWLEEKNVDYVIGYPRNARLMESCKETYEAAYAFYEEEGEKARLFADFHYAADSWKKQRRIIYKAERTNQGENNRFLVTSVENMEPGDIYDGLYTRRGQMENRIKELKNGLFMDRTSCSSFLANQFRVFLTLAAFLLFQQIRRCLIGTEFERAEVDTLRIKFLKIGARIKETARKIWIHFSSAYPLQDLFWNLLAKLQGRPAVQTSG